MFKDQPPTTGISRRNSSNTLGDLQRSQERLQILLAQETTRVRELAQPQTDVEQPEEKQEDFFDTSCDLSTRHNKLEEKEEATSKILITLGILGFFGILNDATLKFILKKNDLPHEYALFLMEQIARIFTFVVANIVTALIKNFYFPRQAERLLKNYFSNTIPNRNRELKNLINKLKDKQARFHVDAFNATEESTEEEAKETTTTPTRPTVDFTREIDPFFNGSYQKAKAEQLQRRKNYRTTKIDFISWRMLPIAISILGICINFIVSLAVKDKSTLEEDKQNMMLALLLSFSGLIGYLYISMLKVNQHAKDDLKEVAIFDSNSREALEHLENHYDIKEITAPEGKELTEEQEEAAQGKLRKQANQASARFIFFTRSIQQSIKQSNDTVTELLRTFSRSSYITHFIEGYADLECPKHYQTAWLRSEDSAEALQTFIQSIIDTLGPMPPEAVGNLSKQRNDAEQLLESLRREMKHNISLRYKVYTQAEDSVQAADILGNA